MSRLRAPIGRNNQGNTTGAFNFDGGTGNCQVYTLIGNSTVTFKNLQPGETYSFQVTQDATGGRALTFDASFSWLGLTPEINLGAGATTNLIFMCVSPTALVGLFTFNVPLPALTTDSITAPNGSDLTLQAGLDGAGPDRLDVNVDLGVLDAGGLSGTFTIQEGSSDQMIGQFSGTPGAPDTNLVYTQFAQLPYYFNLKSNLGAAVDAWRIAFGATGNNIGYRYNTVGPAITVAHPAIGTTYTFASNANFQSSGSFVCNAGTTLSLEATTNIQFFRGTIMLNITTGVVTIGSAATETHRINAVTTAAANAGANVLPATPEGFLQININGTNRKIPFYLV